MISQLAEQEMVAACPGVAVGRGGRGKKRQIVDPSDCEREQSRRLQGKAELPFTVKGESQEFCFALTDAGQPVEMLRTWL